MRYIVFYPDFIKSQGGTFNALVASAQKNNVGHFLKEQLSNYRNRKAKAFLESNPLMTLPNNPRSLRLSAFITFNKGFGLTPSLVLAHVQSAYYSADSRREECKMFASHFDVLGLGWTAISDALRRLETAGYLTRDKAVRRGILITRCDLFNKECTNVRGQTVPDILPATTVTEINGPENEATKPVDIPAVVPMVKGLPEWLNSPCPEYPKAVREKILSRLGGQRLHWMMTAGNIQTDIREFEGGIRFRIVDTWADRKENHYLSWSEAQTVDLGTLMEPADAVATN